VEEHLAHKVTVTVPLYTMMIKEFDMSYPTYSNYNYYYAPEGMYYSYWGYYPYYTNGGM